MADEQATYDLLMLKKIEGQLDVEEQLLLDRWLDASPENRAQYEQLYEAWSLSSATSPPPEPDYEAGWAHVAARIRQRPEDRPAVKRQTSRAMRLGRIVFPLVLLLLALFWYLRPTSPVMEQLIADRGETTSIVLADQSVVQLNSGSRLVYPEAFDGNERRVVLEGEAFFEVQPGSLPFVVESNNAEVTVLGTRFNVNTWHAQTQVTVQEGRVRLSATDASGVSVELAASEGAVVRAANALSRLDSLNSAGAFNWMEGVISFHQMPLWQVVEAVERAFDRDITLDPGIADTPIGGSIRTDALDEALETICLLVSCSVIEEEGEIILK
ncbi:MAG: FecR domain-containing protein [Bacteroidota bacterium]